MKTKIIFTIDIILAIISIALFLVMKPGVTPPSHVMLFLVLVVATVMTFGMGLRNWHNR